MATTKQINQWKEKAEKWDALDKKIGNFYTDEKGEYNEDSPQDDGNLLDIGEIAAIAFGWM